MSLVCAVAVCVVAVGGVLCACGPTVQPRQVVTLSVRWCIEGTARSGVLHLLHVPVGTSTVVGDRGRSDVSAAGNSRRSSAAVITVTVPPAAALFGPGAGARGAGLLSAFPLAVRVEASTVVTADFSSGPCVFPVLLELTHTGAVEGSVGVVPASGAVSFRVTASAGAGPTPAAAPPSARARAGSTAASAAAGGAGGGGGGGVGGGVASTQPSVLWMGSGVRDVASLALGASTSLTFMAAVPCPGLYDVNQFLVEVESGLSGAPAPFRLPGAYTVQVVSG